ncbi:MAG: response regulator [Thiotrichales bacterium]|jgi:two-component system chemotaxis response regulator CheY|nr:response regulator [Thiotrichales bacterium]
MHTILLVDDSATMLMSMSGILKQAGYTVLTANSGDAALNTLKTNKPNLVITDLNMPGMNGIEFIKAAKSNASMRFTPFVMLTTESGASKKDEARAAGAAGWLTKPVVPAQLLQVVKQLAK